MPTRSTHVTFLNRTGATLVLKEKNLDHGRWSIEPNDVVTNEDEWESESHGFATGTEGSVTFIEQENDNPAGPLIQVHLHWDNPFIGGNSYDASVTPQAGEDGEPGCSVGFFGAKRSDHNAEVTFILLNGKATVDEDTGEIVALQVSELTPGKENMPEQRDWRFCNKCGVIFFNGSAGKGICPAGGGHEAGGFMYLMKHELELPNAQREWRFCVKCGVIFFNGSVGRGICPGGGSHEHDPTGFKYVADHDIPESPTAQRDWRFCTKCGVMFFNGPGVGKGICPGGGVHEHDPAGFTYVMAHDTPH